MTYEVVNVTPDSPEWEQERRNSVGASEVPAVMNLSAYGVTPLDIYKSKHGVDRPFDPVLGFIGHASEPIMHEWVERFSGLNLTLSPGFMGRSVKWPFLHATFDRVADDGTKVQMKTAHHYSGHHWDEGIPTDIRVQVQAEMAVSGDSRALVVVWIGGREFRHFWEMRDERFITNHLAPTVESFWRDNVLAGVAPNPSTLAEINAIPTETVEAELSDEAFDVLERITVLGSDISAQEKERDALRVALYDYTGTADTLMYRGQKVATWRQQKGRMGLDQKALRDVHPDIVAEFTVQGQPFRVLRRSKPKETT